MLEKRIQAKLLADPQLKDYFSENSFAKTAPAKERTDPNLLRDVRISNEQAGLKLPHINASVTPSRRNQS